MEGRCKIMEINSRDGGLARSVEGCGLWLVRGLWIYEYASCGLGIGDCAYWDVIL